MFEVKHIHHLKQTNLNKIFWFLIIGIVLVIIAPWLLTRTWGTTSFINTGTIGDTIGGITAPVTSLIGSILVYFALRAQIDANKLIQDQIDEQKKGEIERKKIAYLSQQIEVLRSDFNSFTYNYKDNGLFFTFSGSEAIRELLERRRYAVNQDEVGKLTFPKFSELDRLLDIFFNLANLLTHGRISVEDREYFRSILQYQFDSKLKLFFDHNAEFTTKYLEENPGHTNPGAGLPFSLYRSVYTLGALLSDLKGHATNTRFAKL